jgi:hypothetical protein
MGIDNTQNLIHDVQTIINEFEPWMFNNQMLEIDAHDIPNENVAVPIDIDLLLIAFNQHFVEDDEHDEDNEEYESEAGEEMEIQQILENIQAMGDVDVLFVGDLDDENI